jgi:uncharacterized repeat protein (TIGR02543 family)
MADERFAHAKDLRCGWKPRARTLLSNHWTGSTQTYAGFEFPFDIPVGYVVSITDGVSTKTHTVINAQITGINSDTDVITGISVPNSIVEIGIEDGYYETAADENGDWFINLNGVYDIALDTRVQVGVSDADYDRTFTMLAARCYGVTANADPVGGGSVSVPLGRCAGKYTTGAEVELTATPASGWIFTGWSGDASGKTNPLTVTMDADKIITANFDWPNIGADISKDSVQASGWPNGTLLTMTIDGSESFTATAGPADWDPDQIVAEFELRGKFDLQAGQLITVTDNGSPAIARAYTPTNLTITGFNTGANTMSGKATPDAEVRARFKISGNWVERNTTAGSDGNWTVGYGGIGVVLGSTSIYAYENDANGNQTMFTWRNPRFWAQVWRERRKY